MFLRNVSENYREFINAFQFAIAQFYRPFIPPKLRMRWDLRKLIRKSKNKGKK